MRLMFGMSKSLPDDATMNMPSMAKATLGSEPGATLAPAAPRIPNRAAEEAPEA
jgi:hypothetical protein